MKRRNFLANVGAAALAAPFAVGATQNSGTLHSELLHPRALQAGDTVGLITPSTAVSDPDKLAAADRTLKYFGLKMKLARNAGKRMGTYLSSIDERLDDLHSMFRDPDVKAVFAIRGGYGSEHILDRIDYD